MTRNSPSRPILEGLRRCNQTVPISNKSLSEPPLSWSSRQRTTWDETFIINEGVIYYAGYHLSTVYSSCSVRYSNWNTIFAEYCPTALINYLGYHLLPSTAVARCYLGCHLLRLCRNHDVDVQLGMQPALKVCSSTSIELISCLGYRLLRVFVLFDSTAQHVGYHLLSVKNCKHTPSDTRPGIAWHGCPPWMF